MEYWSVTLQYYIQARGMFHIITRPVGLGNRKEDHIHERSIEILQWTGKIFIGLRVKYFMSFVLFPVAFVIYDLYGILGT